MLGVAVVFLQQVSERAAACSSLGCSWSLAWDGNARSQQSLAGFNPQATLRSWELEEIEFDTVGTERLEKDQSGTNLQSTQPHKNK
ncbi:unnamed protein product [Clonostachys rhizophaga]|uniref:Uncharacterized protein n=1 Tax=Clonostachys rhizophaga TaxID=160324 RepID=A0A9N9YFM8_9HYPO|nr:unnamed protein product [Clonostachys rhizophaga]